MAKESAIRIRWLANESDEPEVHQVARISQEVAGPDGWTAEDIVRFFKKKNGTPKVITIDKKIVGCMFYTQCDGYSLLELLVVDRENQGKGLEAKLLANLKRLLTPRRTEIIANIPERDVKTQVLLRDNGFKWIRTTRSNGPDAIYTLRYTRTKEDKHFLHKCGR